MTNENRISMGRILGAALCDVFGLDPNSVQDISVSIKAGEPAKVSVVMYVSEHDNQNTKPLKTIHINLREDA